MQEIKFTVKNMSPEFYNGFGTITGFNSLDNLSKYIKLQELKRDLPNNIKQKDEQFNRMVELNSLLKSGIFTVNHDVSPRRGYQVHTFTFMKGA